MNLIFESLRCLPSAPDAGVRDEEDLIGRVLFQSRQPLLRPVLGGERLVSPVSLPDPPVIGDVFALRYHSVDLPNKIVLHKPISVLITHLKKYIFIHSVSVETLATFQN